MKDLASVLPFVLIALVFYFLILRPQRRRQQTLVATQSALAPGAEVMLTSGIYGRVASLNDETIQLEVSPGTHVTVLRQAVARVVDERRPRDSVVEPEDEPGSTDQHQ